MQLKPMIIFKANPAPAGKLCGGKNTITYAIHHNKPDRWGNHFPPLDECYITVSATANSNGPLTIDWMHNVLMPELGDEDVEFTERTGVLCDAFKGHYADEVKEHNAKHENLEWLMMDGGITPKCQPLDVLVNKVFKGFFRDLFEQWSLSAPLQDSGHPYAPSCQLLAQWVVAAWKKVPEELVRRSWEVSGYRSVEELEREVAAAALVEYSRQDLGAFVERIAGREGIDAWIDDANDPDVGPEEGFPEDGEVLWELAEADEEESDGEVGEDSEW